MKMTMSGAALVLVALGSLVPIRLTAQEQREATIERVKAQIVALDERLVDTRSKADAAKEAGRQLEAKFKDRLESLKALGKDPAQWTEDARRRLESLKSGDEAKQLQALEGVDKLGDEGVVLCAYAIQAVDRDAVRRKALSLVCALGDAGLPVLVKGFESLAAKDRLFTAKELAKHKDKFDALVFARLARDESAEIRAVALAAGLAKGDPLVFLALAADGNESQAKTLFDAAKTLKGDDLQLFLFAVAKKGPEELLPETVRRAGSLQEAAYPVIAEVFMRKTPESRAEIVLRYRKSTVEVEKFVVQEALKDEDSALRAAAEKANQEP